LPDPSDSAIRELARDILARREYGLVSDNPEQWWLDWLHRFLKWTGLLRMSSPILFWTLIAALSLAAAVIIVQSIRSLRAVLGARAPSVKGNSIEMTVDLAGEAGQLADSGRFLEAAHRLMIACFGVLAQRSVIELRPDCSNRWIRAALRGSPLAAGFAIEIGALVERTERRWFGNRENEPAIYYDWRSVYQRLLSAGD
jgi:hypothetical protein